MFRTVQKQHCGEINKSSIAEVFLLFEFVRINSFHELDNNVIKLLLF